jgi:serralysin
MAAYAFETMTASDAANFVSDDTLFFLSGSVSNLGVTDNPPTSDGLHSFNESITLTEGGVSHTFGAAELSAASQAGHIAFVNGDALALGTSADDGSAGHAMMVNGSVGHGALAFGFGGDDSIHGGAANDTIDGGAGNDAIVGSSETLVNGHYVETDYLMGGAGTDSVFGGSGNDHIYGNTSTSVAGADDGGDLLEGGPGNDYVNGNAGDDTIYGEAGNDRLYGGAGDDYVVGDAGHDYLQGNKGNDTLEGSSGAGDTMHGGAGNDAIFGSSEADLLFGDAGDDTIDGGGGYDTMTGGAGDDVFSFNAGHADTHHVGDTGQLATIADFNVQEGDSLDFHFAAAGLIFQQAGVTVTTLAAAQTYAEQLLDQHVGAGEVAAIQVGNDTILFYNSAGVDVTGADPAHSIDSAVRLLGVHVADLAN